MKTYWFTIAGGTKSKYVGEAQQLARSLERFGHEIDILGKGTANREEAQCCKITGVLNAPSWADKIVYLDADTFVNDLTGFEDINGALQERWGRSLGKCIVKDKVNPERCPERLERLKSELKVMGMTEFVDGSYKEAGYEWNGGVLMGPADFMRELAECWVKWWDVIKKINDGLWERDQASLRFAYHEIGVRKYNMKSIPKEWNWLIKRWLVNENANILHKAGSPDGAKCAMWRNHIAKVMSLVNTESFNEKFQNGKLRVSDLTDDLFVGKEKIEGVEVGVHQGDNAKNFLEKNANLNMYFVDLWDRHVELQSSYLSNPNDKAAKRMKDAEYGRNCYDMTLEKIKPYKKRYRVIKKGSVEASNEFKAKSVDFVYVDAGHEYSDARRDILAWISKIRPGGFICGHDYVSKKNPGVRKAVDEMAKITGLTIKNNKANYADWCSSPLVGDEAEKISKAWGLSTSKVGSYTSYEEYVDIQTRTNKKKIGRVFADPESLKLLANKLHSLIPSIKFGLCHGTRRGVEQATLQEAIAGFGHDVKVIGTEISDTATQFPNTIEWDFHNVKSEWIKSVDFIYSNSLDHSYKPDECLATWVSCLSSSGVCVVEWTKAHSDISASDPFGESIDDMRKRLIKSYCLVDEMVVPIRGKGGNRHFFIFRGKD